MKVVQNKPCRVILDRADALAAGTTLRALAWAAINGESTGLATPPEGAAELLYRVGDQLVRQVLADEGSL